MNPLIICRSKKTVFMTDIAKALYDEGHIDKLFAYVPYFDQWEKYVQKLENPHYEKIFSTREVFGNINDGPADAEEVTRIEKEYGHNKLWNLFLTERWLTSLSTRPLYSKIPYYTKEQKLQCFVGLIKQAEDIFENHDIDCMIDFANIGIFRIALDLVAQKHGIPYYHTDSALLRDLESGDRYFVSRRMNENYSFLDHDHQHYKKNPSKIKEGRDYLGFFRNNKTGSIYSMWFAHDQKKASIFDVHKIITKIKSIAKSTVQIVLNIMRDIKRTIRAQTENEIRYNFALYKADTISVFIRNIQGFFRYNYKRFFCTLITKPPKSKYAFFTMHYQPEASTALMSPFEVNQQAVIENIAKSLPLDVQLVIKLNKTMNYRDPIYMLKEINSLPNVQIADAYANTRDFLEQCHCVVTITGTSGFEGALLGKKTILLGDKTMPWHRLSSVVNVKKWHDLYGKISNVDEFFCDDTDLAAYLQAVHDNSIRLTKNYAWEEKQYDRAEDNYAETINTITNEIVRIHNETKDAVKNAPKTANGK